MPVRAGAGRREPRVSGSWSRDSPTTRSSASSRPSRSPRTTSAASAALHRLPGGLRRRGARRDAAAHRRGVDELRDLRADEAPRRARGGREGAPPPALRGGLRARDAARRRSTAYPDLDGRRLRARAPGEPRDDPPAQRRRRALRPARRDPRRARLGRPLAPPRDDAGVARESWRCSGAEASRARPRSMCRRTPKK